MENKIRGFRQVLAATYAALSDAEKIGLLWFVRPSADSAYGDIYLGTRHYGHYGSDAADIEELNQRLIDAGIVDASGETVNIKAMIDEITPIEGDFIGLSASTEGTVISVVLSNDEGNLLEKGTDNGLSAMLYWEGNDSE